MPEVDKSYPQTDAKDQQNLMALTANGQIKQIMYAEATKDVGNLADGAGETLTITVNGANVGDIVIASFGVDIQDMTVSAYVQAANAVEVRVQNESGGAINLASTTMRVIVFDVT